MGFNDVAEDLMTVARHGSGTKQREAKREKAWAALCDHDGVQGMFNGLHG